MVHFLRTGIRHRWRERHARPLGCYPRCIHWHGACDRSSGGPPLNVILFNLLAGTGHLDQHLLPDSGQLHPARTRRLDRMNVRHGGIASLAVIYFQEMKCDEFCDFRHVVMSSSYSMRRINCHSSETGESLEPSSRPF
jgi:hypothetical protein